MGVRGHVVEPGVTVKVPGVRHGRDATSGRGNSQLGVAGVVALVVGVWVGGVVLIPATDADQATAGPPRPSEHPGGGVDVDKGRLVELERAMNDRNLNAEGRDR